MVVQLDEEDGEAAAVGEVDLFPDFIAGGGGFAGENAADIEVVDGGTGPKIRDGDEEGEGVEEPVDDGGGGEEGEDQEHADEDQGGGALDGDFRSG